MEVSKRIIVVGGGPAGLTAAIFAAERGNEVTVLEKMPRPARKLMITGKGRCNLTNNTDLDGLISSVTKNGRFLYSAFSSFAAEDTVKFFENAGVPLKTERGNRVFPVSDKAVDVVDALVNTAKKAGVKILCETVIEISTENGAVNSVKTESGRTYPADSVVIAAGGSSYPLTGSDGSGFRLASSLGHTVTDIMPSLVPVVTADEWCARLQGLALKNISLKVYEPGKTKPIYTDFGELMFTHFGMSGPTVLSASAHMRKNNGKKYILEIDMKPALDENVLDRRIVRDLAENSNKDIVNALGLLLPKRMIPVAVSMAGIPFSVKANSVTREQRESLVKTLKHMRAVSAGLRPVEEAIVTSGGVKTGEINPSTMESKLVQGLFFAGEVIDVDAYTGGFNLQIAFSTGHLAGMNA